MPPRKRKASPSPVISIFTTLPGGSLSLDARRAAEALDAKAVRTELLKHPQGVTNTRLSEILGRRCGTALFYLSRRGFARQATGGKPAAGVRRPPLWFASEPRPPGE